MVGSDQKSEGVHGTAGADHVDGLAHELEPAGMAADLVDDPAGPDALVVAVFEQGEVRSNRDGVIGGVENLHVGELPTHHRRRGLRVPVPCVELRYTTLDTSTVVVDVRQIDCRIVVGVR